MIISPSIASGDILNLQSETQFVDKHFSNIHMDIQDGVYAKITFGMKTLEQVCSITTSKVSVHLQVMDPLKYLKPILKMGNIDIVHIHINHLKDPKGVISAYKEAGIKTGIGLSNYDLDLDTEKYFDLVDSVLVLTACYGDSNQKYSMKMENYAKNIIDTTSLEMWVDGGIDLNKLPHLKEIGVGAVVLGRSVFQDKDAAKVIFEK